MTQRNHNNGNNRELGDLEQERPAITARGAWAAVIILACAAGITLLALVLVTRSNGRSLEKTLVCEKPVDLDSLRRKRTREASDNRRIRVGMLSPVEELALRIFPQPPSPETVSLDEVDTEIIDEPEDVIDIVTTESTLTFVGPMGGRCSVGRMGGARGPEFTLSNESYDLPQEKGYRRVADHPLSTFSIDVDTASYANLRRLLNCGNRPPAGAVRLEEMINYFDYDYPEPTGEHPFSVTTEMGPCPWNTEHYLVRVGLKGKTVKPEKRPAANLVFLLDVSGSMYSDNKLPLVKKSLRLLTKHLTKNDRVAMVVYAGAAGLVLPSTPGDQKDLIIGALDRLTAGGSTNGGAGIQLAYETAKKNLIPGGVNRVILATDGDFNVGTTDNGDLLKYIRSYAKQNINLSVLGFGTGNYKDDRMEILSNKGNGNYAYVDTLDEAKKVLVEQMSGTLVTIAKDVKIQVEFNPMKVAGYRLIGYDNRRLKKEDFNDDKKDAGEIGAGHCVTAFYEVIPAGLKVPSPNVDELKYQAKLAIPAEEAEYEVMTVKLRYKPPKSDTSILLTQAVAEGCPDIMEASRDFKFAAAVAQFGMLLRDSKWKGTASYASVKKLAVAGTTGAPDAKRRKEFQTLVDKAAKMVPNTLGMK